MGSVALEGFGGGGGLNFKVIPNPQPSTAKENTIWVDTDRINNYYFAVTEPEGMAEYDVWFPVGTSSTVAFSATKKNPIMVYPLSAKQYVSGKWVNKEAESYRDGGWVDWIYYLYNSGNEYTGITGGWKGVNPYDVYDDGTLTKNAGSINLNSPANHSLISVVTNSKIDLREYNKLKINVTAISRGTDRFLNIYVIEDDFLTNVAQMEITSKGTKTLDISGVNGSYHVLVECYTETNATAAASITFDKIWLE